MSGSMNRADEQRLADLLKDVVPEPPRELSADEITAPYGSGFGGAGRRGPGRRSAWSSWGVPSLAAAAMLAIGAFVGLAAHHSTGASAPAAVAGGDRTGVASPVPSLSPLPSASPSASPAVAVPVPNVIGEPAATAEKTMMAAGFRVVVVRENASASGPAGTVWNQKPTAGTLLRSGSEVTLIAGDGGPSAAPKPTATAVTSSCGALAKHTFAQVTSATLNSDGSLTLTAHPVTVVCGGPDDMHYDASTATETGTVTAAGAVEMLTSPSSEQTVPHADVSTHLRADQWGRIFLVTGPLTAITALQEQYHP